MLWWRKKQKQDEGVDNILDLETIVWRGIKPQECFAASVQAEEEIVEREIRDQILAEVDTYLQANIKESSAKNITDHAQNSEQKQFPPDVSNLIKTIVADEIGGWLSNNIKRIIAESIMESHNERTVKKLANPSNEPDVKVKAKQSILAKKSALKFAQKPDAKSAKTLVKKSTQNSVKKTASKTSANAAPKRKVKNKTDCVS